MKINEVVGTVGTDPNMNTTQGKIKRTSGNEVEIEDPNTPGVTKKVDLKKAKVSTDSKGNTSIDTSANAKGGQNTLKPNANVTLNTPKK